MKLSREGIEIWKKNAARAFEVLEDADDEVKNNVEIAIEAVKEHGGLALKYFSDEIKNNPEVVLETVKKDGWALQFASEELRNNPEIVLEAVKQNGLALKFASEELRNNSEIVDAASKQDELAVFYAGEEVETDQIVKGDKVEFYRRAFSELNYIEGQGIDKYYDEDKGYILDSIYLSYKMDPFYERKNIIALNFIHDLNTDPEFRQQMEYECPIEYENYTDFYYDKIYVQFDPDQRFTILPPVVYETEGRLNGKEEMQNYLMRENLGMRWLYYEKEIKDVETLREALIYDPDLDPFFVSEELRDQIPTLSREVEEERQNRKYEQYFEDFCGSEDYYDPEDALINLKLSDLEEIMEETTRNASEVSLDPNTKKVGDNDSNPGGDNR